MTTIIFVFFVAFLASLLLTPLAIRIAKRFNIVDIPMDRKVHEQPVPRLGGAALYFSFFCALVILYLNRFMYNDLAALDMRFHLFLVALTAAFLLGLLDDVRNLPAGLKFFGQIVLGVFSYFAGIKITILSMPFIGFIDLGYFSLPFTVFWFLLAINAINLIDGLDGLAAGICLFVSITMLVICLTSGRLLEAITFAALAGSLIGFLRYNFNPASIFMGDSGSYFLGYLIAAMSILGSIKGQVATAILIPIIALGIPVIDTLVAPVRRFVKGRSMFQPDKRHFHHRLVEMGFSHRRAVLVIYGLTIVLGITAIVMIHARDETAALILMVLGVGVIFLGRYSGLMDIFVSTRFGRWFRDLSFEGDINQARRDFLQHQSAIDSAKNIDEVWEEVCKTLSFLGFDLARLSLVSSPKTEYTWSRKNDTGENQWHQTGLLRIEQPLLSGDGTAKRYGMFTLAKNILGRESDIHSLKRAELLRLVMAEKLERIYSSIPHESSVPSEVKEMRTTCASTRQGSAAV